MKHSIQTALAALVVTSLAGPALATHDGGTHYNLLLVDDHAGALVAECDLQDTEPVQLRLLDWRGRVKASQALPLDTTAQLCQGLPASADIVLAVVTDPAFRIAIGKQGATLLPIAGAAAPSEKVTLHTSLSKTGKRLSMVLRTPKRAVRRGQIRAKAGFSPVSIDVLTAWHPKSKFVYIVGSKVARVSSPVQVFKPVYTPWRVGKSLR